MGFIKAKKVKGIEKPKDSTGAGGAIASGVYGFKVVGAHAVESAKSDWVGVMLELELDTGRKISNLIGVTGSDGQVFTENNGKKRYRSSYLMIDALVNIATEGDAGILDLETEEKIIKKKVDGKDQNVAVESFFDLIGAKGQVGIIATKRFKQNQVDGTWEDTEDVVTVGEFHTFFDEEGFTVNELDADKDTPEFIDEWKKAWEGKERDFAKTNDKAGERKSTGSSGGSTTRNAGRRNLIRK